MSLRVLLLACLVGIISAEQRTVSTSISLGGSDLSSIGLSSLGLNNFGSLFGTGSLLSPETLQNSSISIGTIPALLILLKTPFVIIFKIATHVVSIVALSLFISHLGKQLGYDPLSFFNDYDGGDYDASSYESYSDAKGNTYDVPEESYESNTIHRRSRSVASSKMMAEAFSLFKNAMEQYSE